MRERAAPPRSNTQTPPSRTDWAIEQIRRVILFGEVRAGDRLVSSAWSTRLGISQTPLREAFQRLAAEGFVNYDSQRGASVAALTLQDACEIYQLRILLDPLAVESSVKNATAKWRRELSDAFELVDTLYASPDTVRSGSVEAHRAFHRTLRANCESTWLLRIADTLADQSTRMQFASLSNRGGHWAARAEHLEIYETALAGDAAHVAKLSSDHLQRTLDALRTDS